MSHSVLQKPCSVIFAPMLTVWFLTLYCAPAPATIYYVNPGESIQTAIDSASYGDTIHVAAGTYLENITLKNGVALIGEVIGSDPNNTIIDGNAAGSVVTSNYCDPNTILEGFMITNGDAIYGGGMFNVFSDPTLTNCTFSNNSADNGGGMCNHTSSPIVTNCTFSINSANDIFSQVNGYGGGMFNGYDSCPAVSYCIFWGNSANDFSSDFHGGAGGGMYNLSSDPTVTNCTFSDNSALYLGGGMCNEDYSDPIVTNCSFWDNSTLDRGGGLSNNYSHPIVRNCTFTGNNAFGPGGGMHNHISSPIITNCILNNNSADDGGGLFNYSSSSVEASNPRVINCIFWGNIGTTAYWNNEIGNSMDTTCIISFSDISDCFLGGVWDATLGTDGGGNIDVDPMFFSSNAPYDFHLQPGSPCIDAGDNNAIPADITTDLDGQPRFVDDSTIDTGSGIPPLVDMGVFEYHPLFVDASAAGDNNGQTWKDAYNYLQDALHDPCLIYHGQIFIARGTYKPDQDTAGNVTFGSRYESFNLVDGIAIYGGFQNGGCTWQYRNPLGYQTILSGDLAGNDRRDYTLNEENSYHVVYAGRAGSDTILDGLTIYGGNADGDFPFGGGMYNEESSPTVIRCNFIGNSAANFGGGMFSNGGSPLIINNSFFGNSTDSQGGAMFNKYSEPSIINTVFSANTAHYGEGGAIYNQGQDPIITSCSFTANAAHDGGALFNHSGSPTISNTIMWLNTAAEGDQIFNPDNNHYPLIKYCDIQDSYGSGPAWNHNLGTDGGGNIDVDPRFLDADGPDDQTGTADDTLFLSYKSPCIDAGDNGSIPNDTTDLDQDGDTSELIPYDHDYHDRRTDDPPTLDTGSGPLPHIEIGAYERFEFCGDAKHPYPPGDQNQDCIFDLRDFAIIAAWWLQYTGPG